MEHPTLILDQQNLKAPATAPPKLRRDAHAGAQPIFPGLRQLQNTIRTTPSINQQQKPFFSLLEGMRNSANSAPSLDPHPSEQIYMSSTTDIGVGTGTNFLCPQQVLPPPTPPEGPDSRPPSYAPQTRPLSRAKSRLSGSMALGGGDEEGDNKDLDVDVVMLTALKSARTKSVELEEERRRSQLLLVQLNSLKHAHEALKGDASVLRAERDKAILKREQADKKVEVLRQGMSELGESYAVLKTTFSEFKESCENEKKSCEDAQNAKLWARESLKKLEPLLEDNKCLAKEARALVTSLKEELADSRHVIDILRDKLHHLSSIHADARNQVRELEDARRESTEQMKSFLERVEKGAEERVENMRRKMEEMEGELNVLKECRNAKLTQDIRLEHLAKTLSELQEAHNITTTALGAVRSECIELGGVNNGLMRSLAEAEEKRCFETAAHEKKLNAMKKVVEEVEESQRQKDHHMAALQERFNAQTMTLQLSKEHYGHHQETLNKTRETLDAIRENARAEVLEITKELLKKTEELRQSDARLAEHQERFAVLQASKQHVEQVLSDSRKIQETQTIALERANFRCIELEAKVHMALKEKADRWPNMEVELASSKEQLEAREMITRLGSSEEILPSSTASAKSILGKRDRVACLSQTQGPIIPNLDQKAHTWSHRLRNGAALRTTNSSSAQVSMTVQKKAVDSSTKPKKKRK